MKTTDLFMEAASSFATNRVRSSIILIGVVIGIATIVSMSAILGGLRLAIIGEEGQAQERLVDISCSYDRSLSYADSQDMAKQLDDVFEIVMPSSDGIVDVASSSVTSMGFVKGVHPEYAFTMKRTMVQGRFITQEEYDKSDVVVVLDEASVRMLFGSASENVVGKMLSVQGTDYEIVGVMSSDRASRSSESINICMPFTTCARRVTGDTKVSEILALAREDVDPEKAAFEAEKWLAERLKIPESERDTTLLITTMKTAIERFNLIMTALQLVSVLMSSVSLLMGGIGILGIMLTSVAERNREISIRKALGASKRDITIQFLLEAVCLTLGGGAIGTIIGYLSSFGLASIAGTVISLGEGMTITPTIGIGSILLVVGICVFIGVVFGCYPAYRAGKLDPIEPLRYQ